MLQPCTYNDDAGDSGNSEIEVLINANIIRAKKDLAYSLGNTTDHCLLCKKLIPKERREFIKECRYCVNCQQEIDPMPYVTPLTFEDEEPEVEELDYTKLELKLVRRELIRLNKNLTN